MDALCLQTSKPEPEQKTHTSFGERGTVYARYH